MVVPINRGCVLSTLNSERNTNGICIDVTDAGKRIVLTDFGNIIELTEYDAYRMYKVADSYIEMEQYNYPFPSIIERIDEQIVKLKEAKQHISREDYHE